MTQLSREDVVLLPKSVLRRIYNRAVKRHEEAVAGGAVVAATAALGGVSR